LGANLLERRCGRGWVEIDHRAILALSHDERQSA
jgi:hypothetical protein